MFKYLYVPGDSFYHRLDPRTKLLVTLAVYIATLMLKAQLFILVAMLIACVLLAFATNATQTLRSIRVIITVISITSVLSWCLIGNGVTPLVGFITWEALGMGISASLRGIISIIISIIWLASTRNEEISTGIMKMGVPYRAAFAFQSSLRMAPVLINMTLTVIAAQKSRGLDTESGGLFQRIKRSLPLIVPAFLLTMRSTDTFSQAIESKGFGYKGAKRTNYLQLHYSKMDFLWLGLAALLVAGSIAISSLGLFMQFTPMD
jgi:energy-coupling factor transport system permease protein